MNSTSPFDTTFAQVDAPVPKPMSMKISDMLGLVVVVFGWDKPFNKHCDGTDPNKNEDFKILVYDMENKKVYEATHPNNEPDPKRKKRIVEVDCAMILYKTLTLTETSATKSCMMLSNMRYQHFRSYVLRNGAPLVHVFTNLMTSSMSAYHACYLSYQVCGQWTTTTSENAPLDDMNSCALFILGKYKDAMAKQSDAQKVLKFKI